MRDHRPSAFFPAAPEGASGIALKRDGGSPPWRRRVRRMLDNAAGWLYPPVCRACGRALLGCRDAILCSDCHARLPWLGRTTCRRCGVMIGTARRECRRCRRGAPPFTRAVGALRYHGPARDLVLSLKFGGDRVLATAMAQIMAVQARAANLPACDWVTPIPLHASRRRMRGYNQASLLSRGVARALGFPHREKVLARVLPTVEQTSLSGAARRAFPEGAFAAKGPTPGAKVLLVDDVVTTGATAGACARALFSAGAAEVCVLAFAR